MIKQLTILAVALIVPAVLVVVQDFHRLAEMRDATAAGIERAGAVGANTWLGKTGETYAVDPDFRLIGDSRFPDRIEASGGIVKTTATIEAMAGNTGSGFIRDYGGEPVLSAYRPVELNGEKVAIASEIDLNEVLQKIALTYFAAGVLVFATMKAFRNVTNDTCDDRRDGGVLDA